MKGDLVVAFGRDLIEVAVSRFAGIEAQFLLRFPLQEIPGALDIGSGERLAIMPFEALPQLERQPLTILAPGPAFGKVGHDRIDRVALLVLIEQHEVVEHRHQYGDRGARHLLMDRHRSRTGEIWHLEDAARFLRQCSLPVRLEH